MVVLEPTSNEYEIPYIDSRVSEFEIQSMLLEKLRQHGIQVKGEVTFYLKEKRRKCRFDLVIYENKEAKEIIEVKDSKRKYPRGPLEETRQGVRYRWFGVPVVFIFGLEDAKNYLRDQWKII